MSRRCGILFQLILLTAHIIVSPLCHGWQQHPVLRFRVIIQLILRPCFRFSDHCGARMRQTCCHSKHHRKTHFFRVVKHLLHHVVRLLLVRRFKTRHHGKLGIKTRVLFILRRVHGWVIGNDYHNATIDSRHCRVDKRICRHVHTHMFHANHGSFPHVRHAQRLLHRCLFVRSPTAMHTALTR